MVDSPNMQPGVEYDVRDSDGPESRYKSSASPEPAAKQQRHRRNYQACEPCRERKVKCDMGDVDNPHGGPCKKCAREKKTCYFAPQRKKPSTSRDSITGEPPNKRPRNSSNNTPAQHSALYSPTAGNAFPASSSLGSPFSNEPFASTSPAMNISGQPPTSAPMTPSPRSMHSHYPPAPTSFPKPNNATSNNGQVQDSTTQNKANDEDGHLIGPQANSLGPSFTNTIEGFATLVDAASKLANAANNGFQKNRSRTLTGGPLEPPAKDLSEQEVAEREHAKSVWNRMRFVRAGWLTAEEAMDHVDYFYRNLATMTPVISQNFSAPSTHKALLTEEPVLALAIMSIASRHVMLQTPGKTSRNFYIHEKLWEALRCIVQRLLWGQEQFGGGFCGAGLAPIRESATGQITWKGSLRTLGTIEALLLLTDWQPRALHFPPGDDENKLIVGDFELLDESDIDVNGTTHANLPYAKWLEPAWRSDRMSWMLLGLAQSLAYELGVFNTEHNNCDKQHGPDSDCVRKRRIRRMLITYVCQISGRIGIQSSLSPAQDGDENIKDSNEPIDRMQKLWFDIASIMFDANSGIFPSREYTNNLIYSGKYKAKIAEFVPRLQKWDRDFAQAQSILDPPMRHILRMEYDYARLYINSLGMQRVVDYWVQQVPAHAPMPERMQQLIPVVSENKRYIDEVRTAATRILREVLDGLARSNNLKDAPVRTFLRSLSGMMFTLKLFSLGNDARTVKESMKLLKATTQEMSDHVVDDVHLSKETSRLIQILMDDVSKTMIRIQKPVSRDQSRQMSPQLNHQFGQGLNNDYSSALDNESPDPLGEIPFADAQNQLFIPPPNFDLQMLQDPNMAFDTNIDPAMYNMSDDWYTMPLNNLFNAPSSNVNQGFGGIGPTLGDRDMLAILTDNQYDQSQINGMSQGYGGFNNGF